MIDDPVLTSLFRRHKVVAMRVLLHFLIGLIAMRRQDAVDTARRTQDVARLDLDVGCCALELSPRPGGS
jgi:hypothetical protein